ncbi:MAG TPA: hypothetical protein VE932_00230 [Patescibacteria group bacterium]|nr:hypothetical protein [Patescibacteria group bacterium]
MHGLGGGADDRDIPLTVEQHRQPFGEQALAGDDHHADRPGRRDGARGLIDGTPRWLAFRGLMLTSLREIQRRGIRDARDDTAPFGTTWQLVEAPAG